MSTTYNAFISAIASEENSTWTNNPGALETSQGTPQTFASYDEGYNALSDYVDNAESGNSKIYSPNMSLANFEAAYTGGDTNAGANVANILGVSPSTPISQLSDQTLDAPYSVNDAGTYSLNPDMGVGDPNTVGNVNTNASGTTTLTTAQGTQTAPASSSGFFSGLESWITASTSNVVAVILGLILIAGAVFGFSAVRDAVVKTAKISTEMGA